LYIDLGGWHGDNRRVAIGIGIGIPIWPPIRPPERSEPDGDPWASKPVVEAMVEAVTSEPMPATPRVAWPRAQDEQCRQHDDDPHPLLPGSHGHSLPCVTMSMPCETSPPATWRETPGRCQSHPSSPATDISGHRPHDFNIIPTTFLALPRQCPQPRVGDFLIFGRAHARAARGTLGYGKNG